MININRYKVEYGIIIPLIIFSIISVISIYSAQQLLPSAMENLALKQTIWFVAGFAVAYLIMMIGNTFFIKNVWFLYAFGILSLVFLLMFGTPINDAKSWFPIFGLGTIQPSEFVKIILILTIAKIIDDFNEKHNKPTVRDELILFIKVSIVVLIPSVLTFLQPDTGIVIIYFIIMIIMLLVGGIRWQIIILFFSIFLLLFSIFLSLYFFDSDLFIKLFGTNFFYRIDRLLDWQGGVGMQLSHALMAIGGSGLLGFGFNNTPIYFPEPHTDFIFSVYASNFGLLGSIFLIMIIIFFNLKLINIASRSSNNINKYIISGIIGMLIYQQIQSIGMNVGLLPITGITLPFISYGGSSLLSYMIMVGIIFNLSNDSLKYTNVK
jgi:rod shape determining protein RodA